MFFLMFSLPYMVYDTSFFLLKYHYNHILNCCVLWIIFLNLKYYHMGLIITDKFNMSYVSFPLLVLPRILLINMLVSFQIAFRVIYEYLLMVPRDCYHLILIYIRRYWLIWLWIDNSVFCLSFPITSFLALEKSEHYFLIFDFWPLFHFNSAIHWTLAVALPLS